ncbi:hypothetical protein OsJ_01531 [Oryza sativa Japonica Group]|uniref:F-box domain-containing protein n=1 Tax=Oryza sativa subsp. japonica TaxID=39947 RepID=B9EW41_ORYSJ|nr:hypothetical protein OsJ_01531 [Oryza sativa Japonica Group]
MMKKISHQFLPDDLVLDIVARSRSPATIIRCAAVSKPLRRLILHPSFLRRVVIPSGTGHDDDDPSFIPSLLLGVYHRPRDDPCCPLAFVPAARGAAAGASIAAASSLPPVSPPADVEVERPIDGSHGGAGAHHHGGELTVWNPASGGRWVLPPHDHEVLDQSIVLLDVANWAFPLIWKFQRIPSSKGKAKPVVLRGGRSNGFASRNWGHRILVLKWPNRDAAAAAGAQATMASLMKLPPPCESGAYDTCLALSPSPSDGTGAGAATSLSVVVLVGDHIAVWVRAAAARWERRHVVREESIIAAWPMEGSSLGDGWLGRTRLGWFCEGSGALLLERDDDDGRRRPLVLDMGAMVVRKVDMDCREAEFVHYEVDLVSYMMFVMRAF